jgi:uncharacterized alkaline shock family protein YloU
VINNSGTDIAESVILVKVANAVEKYAAVRLTKKKKAIKINDTEKVKTIDLFIDIDYGTVIPKVVNEMQHTIARSLDEDLDIVFDAINVTVEGVNIDRLDNKKEF